MAKKTFFIIYFKLIIVKKKLPLHEKFGITTFKHLNK